MLESLQFVKGAVSKKDLVPSLSHFLIQDRTIRGYNGKIALSSFIDIDLTATPKAAPFIKAIETCKDTVALSMTPAGRLAVRSGKFKAYVECIESDLFPPILPEGDRIALPDNFLTVVKQLAPFIAKDASRPWATGMLFRGGSAFATNNIVIIERWIGEQFPIPINIPVPTIRELLRIKLNPVAMQMTDTSVTFHYDNDRWLRSQLLTTEWPDLAKVLDNTATYAPVEDSFFEAVESLLPFVDEYGRVVFTENGLCTSLAEGIGASCEYEGQSLYTKGCFQAEQLLALKGNVDKIDFNSYPKPCLFTGKNLRGAIIGARLHSGPNQ